MNTSQNDCIVYNGVVLTPNIVEALKELQEFVPPRASLNFINEGMGAMAFIMSINQLKAKDEEECMIRNFKPDFIILLEKLKDLYEAIIFEEEKEGME